MDYVDGKLLVDPQKMMKDAFGNLGLFMALCIGRHIEKTWSAANPWSPRKPSASACLARTGAISRPI